MSDNNNVENYVPGRNGGRLNRGGTKGNKGGGRPPAWFKDLCAEMVSSPAARKSVKAILAKPDHPHFAAIWKAVSERGYGKPESKVDVVVKHYREAIDEVRTGLRLVA